MVTSLSLTKVKKRRKKRRKLRRSKVPEGVGHFVGVAVSETLPPVDFVSENGEVIFTCDQIVRGEEVLHLRDLIWHGSFLGDGAERGPDYMAEAFHVMCAGAGCAWRSAMVCLFFFTINMTFEIFTTVIVAYLASVGRGGSAGCWHAAWRPERCTPDVSIPGDRTRCRRRPQFSTLRRP